MRDENGRARPSPLGQITTLLVVFLLPLVAGLFLAPRLVTPPKIGLIRVNYEIFSDTAFEFGQQMAYARQEPDVRAVVLVINSPGGSAAYSEEMYLDVLHTREQMPVIASIDLLAASGAYYLAAAATEIYAKPTSNVGSVGVIAFLPGEVFIEDEMITTGPYKAFGGTQDGFLRQMERAKFTFLEAVQVGRGDRLQIAPEVLSRAEIYTGVQAWEYGLVDDLLATDAAIQQAAVMAGLRAYEVVELYPLALELDEEFMIAAYQPPPIDMARLWAPPQGWPAGVYYRYVAPVTR